MVFVWSYLTRGDAAYTLVQVALNDLIMLFAFAPIVVFLLGVSNIPIPWDTVALSVVLYIVIPLAAGYLTRRTLIARHGIEWYDNVFMKKVGPITPVGLIITLVLLFAFQGEVILEAPLHIVLIAIPLILQTFLIFFIAYGWAKAWKVPHNVAAPRGDDRCQQLLRAGGGRCHRPLWPAVRRGAGHCGGRAGGGAHHAHAGKNRQQHTRQVLRIIKSARVFLNTGLNA